MHTTEWNSTVLLYLKCLRFLRTHRKGYLHSDADVKQAERGPSVGRSLRRREREREDVPQERARHSGDMAVKGEAPYLNESQWRNVCQFA